MEAINIKNISVQPNVGPAVSLRIINSYINDELNGAKAGDVLNVKAIQKLLSEISGTPGLKGDKGDKGDTGAQGDKGDKGETGAAFTYSDFTAAQLAALKGEKGDTGAQGPKGDTYSTGVTAIDVSGWEEVSMAEYEAWKEAEKAKAEEERLKQ